MFQSSNSKSLTSPCLLYTSFAVRRRIVREGGGRSERCAIERMLNDMLTYNQNIALIMEGKTPVARVLSLIHIYPHGG